MPRAVVLYVNRAANVVARLGPDGFLVRAVQPASGSPGNLLLVQRAYRGIGGVCFRVEQHHTDLRPARTTHTSGQSLVSARQHFGQARARFSRIPATGSAVCVVLDIVRFAPAQNANGWPFGLDAGLYAATSSKPRRISSCARGSASACRRARTYSVRAFHSRFASAQ